MARSRGFTLIELAIVLIIIGILIGFILKGQELIKNAQIKRLYRTYLEIVATIYSYYDRYGHFPGDDDNVSERWGISTLFDGNGNGRIETANPGVLDFNCTDATNTEECNVWYHLRLGEFISGTGKDNPTHSYGGPIAIGYITLRGLTYHWIGFRGVPADIARDIDLKYDDGLYNSGWILGENDYSSPEGTNTLFFRFK